MAAAVRSASWDESSDGGEEKDDIESGRKEKGKEIERMNSDNEATDEGNDEEFYRPESNDTPLDLLMTLLDEDEDMDVYETVVEDGKDSEAERLEGVGEHQIIM